MTEPDWPTVVDNAVFAVLLLGIVWAVAWAYRGPKS